jgi:hypothetical protein
MFNKINIKKFLTNTLDVIKTYINSEVYYVNIPDYGKMEDVNLLTTATSTWTVDRDGFVKVTLLVNGHAGTNLTIDGALASRLYAAGTIGKDEIFPVRVGNVLSWSDTWVSNNRVVFIPPVKIPTPKYPSAMIPDWSKPELHFTVPSSFFPSSINDTYPNNNSSGSEFIMPYDGLLFIQFYPRTEETIPHIFINNNLAMIRHAPVGWQSFSTFARKNDIVKMTVYGPEGSLIWDTGTRVWTYPLVPSVPPLVNDNYSLTEINTGKKWIDNKDIYRKVFQATSSTIDTVVKIPYETDIDTLIDLKVNFKASNGFFYNGTSDSTMSQFSSAVGYDNDKTIHVYAKRDILENVPMTIIIEYTKQ